MFSKIMCAIDTSASSQRALHTAATLAARSGGDLTIAHASRSTYATAHGYTQEAGELPLAAETISLLADEGKHILATAEAEAVRLGAPRVFTRLLTGTPRERILELAQSQPAYDLLVVGTPERTGMSRLRVGSTPDRVLRHAPCSVLIMRGPKETAAFRNVLCAVDFSECARRAMEATARIIAPGGHITLVHVLELPPNAMTPALLDEAEDRAAQRLDAWATELETKTGVRVERVLRVGNAATQLLTVLAEDPAMDLVVIGGRGTSGEGRSTIGSVTERLSRHAPCPVLVARSPLPTLH